MMERSIQILAVIDITIALATAGSHTLQIIQVQNEQQRIFILMSIAVISAKFIQIVMAISLFSTTLSKDLIRSMRVAESWLKVSLFLMLVLTVQLTSTVAMTSIAKVFNPPHWTQLLLAGLDMLLRIFSLYWISKYIDSIIWLAELKLNVSSVVTSC